jgi:gamma-glutamylaminecyclotransferase
MAVSNELVFVYGTLRRGGSHHWRMDGAEFVRAGTIRGRMYRFDWYPGLIADENGGEIIGEIYQVGPAQLAALDLFEGLSAGEIEGSEYRRVRVEVGGGDPVTAWIWEWLGPVDEPKRIAGGDWLACG